MGEEVIAILPKISVCAVEAKELGQLRAGEKESDTAFETGHDAFGNEIHNDACFHEPRDERDQRHQQSGSRSECAKARRIATRDLTKRGAREQRDRGRDGDDGVLRTTKQPEDKSAK